ncbi:hypothetical protein R6Q59_033506 [Mikania micrantha]
MNPDAWVRVIEELFTTPTYQKRSQANSANRSKQLYGVIMGRSLMHKDDTLKSKKPGMQNMLKVGGRCTLREAQVDCDI